MIVASFDDTRTYVLKEDRELPEGERTVFTLRPLSERTRRRLENIMGQNMIVGGGTDETRMSIPVGDLHAACLTSGIAGWAGMRDRKGRTVEYRRAANGDMESELLNCFTIAQKSELMSEIMAMNGISAGDEKN